MINVASTNKTLVLDLVRNIENFFEKKAEYRAEIKGSSYDIDVTVITPIILSLGIDFGTGYIEKSLKKYFLHLIYPPKLISLIVPT